MNKAFTLVELAIVLIIIGLITGGVVGAQSLIESGKRQSIIKEMTELKTIISAFRLEYDALPGDFKDAEEYWGASNTLNGNGNGIISRSQPYYEMLSFWNHLSNAELINQDIEDVCGGCYDPNEPLRTLYGSSLGPNFHYVVDEYMRHSGFLGSPFHDSISIGLTRTSTYSGSSAHGFLHHLPSLNPSFVYKIDKKIDDGLPLQGIVGAFSGDHESGNVYTNPDCHVGAGWRDLNSTYNLEYGGVACGIMFLLQSSSGKLDGFF